MNPKRPIAARPPWRRLPLSVADAPKEPTPKTVAVEEFEREQMGLAAKE